jgi:DNA invertase Pin-like site-specific DNA recombinase
MTFIPALHSAENVRRSFSVLSCSKNEALLGQFMASSRFATFMAGLVRLVAALTQQSIAFVRLSVKIIPSSAADKLVFHVFAALAEFERHLIRERTHAALAAARACGSNGWRKPALSPQHVREIKALLRDPSIPVASIAARYGVSRATIYKHAGADAPVRHQSGLGSGPVKGANRV